MDAAAIDVDLVPVLLDGSGVVQSAKLRRRLVVCRIRPIKAEPVGGVPGYIIDEAAVTVIKSHHAQSQFIFHQGKVEDDRAAITRITLGAAAKLEIDDSIELVHDRLIRDDSQGTSLGVRAIQCALRARQRFDALNVHAANHWLGTGLCDRDLVKIDRRCRLGEPARSSDRAAEYDGARDAVSDDVH